MKIDYSSRKHICQKAIATFGERNQQLKAIEELSELSQALARAILNIEHNVEEEIADVEIMLMQLRLMTSSFDISEIERIKDEKLKRLAGVVW